MKTMIPARAITKIELAKEFLSAYNTVSTREILKVRARVARLSYNGKCSERMIWRALKQLREENEKLIYNYSDIQRFVSDSQFLLNLFRKILMKPRKLSINEVRRLDLFEEYVGKLSDLEDVSEYVRYLREIEGVEIDDLGVPNTK